MLALSPGGDEREGPVMQAGRRHVLIIDKPLVVKNVLDELSAGVESVSTVPHEIRRGLEEFSKHGGARLILDLQVIEAPFGGAPATIRNISAYLVGGVLIVTGQVTSPWILRILQIKADRRRRFSPEHLISSFGALISSAGAEVETAVLRIASPVMRTIGTLGRAHAR